MQLKRDGKQKKSKQGMEERDPGSVNSLAASASEQRTSRQYPIRQFYLWQLLSRIAIAFHAKRQDTAGMFAAGTQQTWMHVQI